MGKKIISVQDQIKIEDDKIQIETITEKELKSMNVNIDNINFKGLKSLKKEWYNDIIKINIENIKEKAENVNFSDSSVVLHFKTIEKRKLFYEYFRRELFRSVNRYLEGRNLNIKQYNRILVFEITDEELSIAIRY